jgi:hypothetical protein
MARKTIVGLEKVIKEKEELIDVMHENYNKLMDILNDFQNKEKVVKKSEYDKLKFDNDLLRKENEKLKEKVSTDLLKKENEELKDMVNTLKEALKNKPRSGRKQKLDDADKFLIIFEYGNGVSMDYLAKKFKVAKGTIWNVIHSK